MSPLFRGGRRRSTGEPDEPWFGMTDYYCTGGAGVEAAMEAAATGLALPGSGHVPVTAEAGPGQGLVRCPACGLTKPFGYKRRKLIREARLTEVDISKLPF
jgi:hypothetical protein